VPLALLRAVGQLIGKRPGRVVPELAAAVSAAFSPTVAPARAALARARTLGWSAIAPLRLQSSHARELAATRTSGVAAPGEVELPRPGFFATGGAWTILALAAIGIIGFGSYLNATALAGGGLAPLSRTVPELWANPTTADPFSWVLALLGTLFFWSPSTSIVALYLAALPLAGLAAWACAARFSTKGWAPAVAAVLWALAPPFLASLSTGHLGAVIAHLALPWLVLAAVNAAKSWSAVGAAALLFAVTVASAPVLGPVLAAAWLALAVARPRSLYRTWLIPLPTAVLFAPLVIAQLGRGTPLGLLADPGVVAMARTASGWQLALGSPAGGSNGWTALVQGLGLAPATALIIVAALLAPLAALAILALFLPGSRRAVPLLAVSLLGFLTAVVSAHLELSHSGAITVPVWAGSALSVYWLGLVGAAAVALEALASAVVIPALLSIVTSLVLAGPLVLSPLLGTSAVYESNGRLMPAFVTAQSATRPDLGTLVLVAQPDGSIAASVHHGAGTPLDKRSTLRATDIAAPDAELATIVGNLAGHSGADLRAQLGTAGITFVLVPEAPAGQAATARNRVADSLDANPAFIGIGETTYGYLWRFTGEVTDKPAEPAAPLPQLLTGVVFAGVALLAIPTGTRRRPVAAVEGQENPADTFEEDENA
jgi:hypothetical protein